MDAVCARDTEAGTCQARALVAALHCLNLYCASISAALVCCCSSSRPHWYGPRWRCQNIRGIASLALGVSWSCGAAAAALRAHDSVRLVGGLIPPLSWLAAAILHLALWTRRSSPPLLYSAIYWLLSAASSAAILFEFQAAGISSDQVEIYIHGITMILALIISAVDILCFYDEVTKRTHCRRKTSTKAENILYTYDETHFYSKITFFWLNSLLYKGYFYPIDKDDYGTVPEHERSHLYFNKFKSFYHTQISENQNKKRFSIWLCYCRMVWPRFYIAGILKLLNDVLSIVPAIGLGIIIQYLEEPKTYDYESEVTIEELFSNGYVMLLIVTLALIVQALVSQNSTHLVTVEGTRLKMALQGIIYDKCMRIASWSSEVEANEESPLLHNPEEEANTQTGLLMNLISQDTYNVMSCVWICHYVWAVPLKVVVILYFLYTKLGVSALVGAAASLLLITPLQFFIGKKISDNSRGISKCTDHRVSKISEILQGMDVIKLYVWEDFFNEKILQLREVELKLLNKDSMYWGFLTFTMQISPVFVTVITFTSHYFLENNVTLNAVNVFAGLALFNQLTISLLILPVTVLMVIQAMVSTKRIKDFLELPESYNVRDNVQEDSYPKQTSDAFHDIYLDGIEENPLSEREEPVPDSDDPQENDDKPSVVQGQEYLVRFRNAALSWRMKENSWLEIDDLDIPAGKVIMVVGSSGSGKSSLLSAILGEMHHERGDVHVNGQCSMWYAGQPPWLLEGTIKDNILMGNAWCPNRYARVLRATGLRPDLQLLPDGDNTQLGSHGTPLSGGQRVRVSVARALYSPARLVVLDEPLGALDAVLARHLVARALLPAARAGRTVLLATNRLELLHYADMVIAMEEGRVSGWGRATTSTSAGAVRQWARLAAEARAAAARAGAGPPGGAARERDQLLRAVSRLNFQKMTDDSCVGINEVAGAHLLAEVPVCGGTWRRGSGRARPSLARQFSSPPLSLNRFKSQLEVRRSMSVNEATSASEEVFEREAGLLGRLWQLRPYRTLSRWTPRTLRRLISSDSDTINAQTQYNGTVVEVTPDATFTSITSNGIETTTVPISEIPTTNKEESEPVLNECTTISKYAHACGWWGATFWIAAVAAQAVTSTADYWLSQLAARGAGAAPTETWDTIKAYALWCVCGACAAACAQVACACAGAAARRVLHERLLHATLHAPLHHHHTHPAGDTLHRFSADTLTVDKKLTTAVSRWAQLALLCAAATLVNAVVSPWTLVALIPAILAFIALQSIYLQNAGELQHLEAESAARAVSLAAQALSGAGTVRVGRLQARMRSVFNRALDDNHNALLLLNSANRWMSLSLDLVGAGSVFVSLAAALYGGRGPGGLAGLAGSYALLLPTLLAHLAKACADLHLQLAAVQRLLAHSDISQEDYREDFQIPSDWQRNGKIEFQNVNIQHQPDSQVVLKNINLDVKPGQKLAICGRSGSGKSTLLMSCAGATSIHSGRILLDGQDITRVPLRALRHRIVVLPQEAVIFSGTLRDNIDPLAMHTDEEIWQSLRAVGLVDFVSAQPAGLECSVSGWRGGAGRGAGRGARVCAARAALQARLAAALLLDEPGAALDAAAERALLRAIADAAPNTTILTVAHRVSSVRGYECAAVLESGRVAERGALAGLLAAPASRLSRLLAAEHRPN